MSSNSINHVNNTQHQDIYFMNLALQQAQKGIYITRPNPSVGCVLVQDNQVISAGYTSATGGNHAEINALLAANTNKRELDNVTAYVTLEPCSHYGKTPPCAKKLIESGIKRVVIAGFDPNPKVAGRGVAMLKNAGISVTTDVLTQQAECINKGFLKSMRIGMPYVRLKIATSLDGRTAMKSGESKWITGDAAREDVQKIRALSGAIITGSQTIIDDDPSLTVRSNQLGIDTKQILQPKVVVLDRRSRLSDQSDYTVCQRDKTLFWHDDDLKELLATLVGDYQCYDVMIEAGATVAGAFIKLGLVDELIVYQAPCILGNDAKGMLNLQVANLANQHRFKLMSHEKMGEDLKLVFCK